MSNITHSISNSNTNSSNNFNINTLICPECNYSLDCKLISFSKGIFMCTNTYVSLFK